MSDPLEKVLREAQGWEPPPSHVEDARRRGQRVKRARMAGFAAAALMVLSVGSAGVYYLADMFRDPQLEINTVPAEGRDMTWKPAAFAIRTVAEAGLMDIRGTFYEYTDIDIQEGPPQWVATFTRASCSKRTCIGNGEVLLSIKIHDGSFRVDEVTGDAKEDEIEALLGQTQPVDHRPPLAAALSIHTYTLKSGHTAVEAAGGWLGPLSYEGEGAACDLIVTDRSGSTYVQKNTMYIDVPEDEDRRSGAFYGARIPIGLQVEDIRYTCVPGEDALPEPGSDTPCPFSRPAYTCTQANWLREIVKNEGLRVFSTQNDALTFKAGSFTLQAWVMTPRGSAKEVAERGGYRPLGNSGMYSDGERIFWGVQNVLVFLAPTADGNLDRLAPSFVAQLKRQSRHVPHPDSVATP